VPATALGASHRLGFGCRLFRLLFLDERGGQIREALRRERIEPGAYCIFTAACASASVRSNALGRDHAARASWARALAGRLRAR
jgi:hypothetical protein